MSESTLYIIDAAAFVHAAYHARADMAAKIFAAQVERLIERKQPTHVALAGDAPGPTFRHELFPDYKRGRAEKRTEMERADVAEQMMLARRYTEELARWVQASGFEADDVAASLVALAEEEGARAVVVCKDKDFVQLVSPRCSLWNGEYGDKSQATDEANAGERLGVSPALAVDYLAMVGDAVDGVPGIRNVGPVGALKALSEFGSLEAAVASAEAYARNRAATAPGDSLWSDERKLWSALAGAREQAELMRRLVRLRRDAPLGIDSLDALRCPAP